MSSTTLRIYRACLLVSILLMFLHITEVNASVGNREIPSNNLEALQFPGLKILGAIPVLRYSPQCYYEATGKKLNAVQRLELKRFQKKLAKALVIDPDLDLKSFIAEHRGKQETGKKIAFILLVIVAVAGLVYLEHKLRNR